jgi:hypothetical protein
MQGQLAVRNIDSFGRRNCAERRQNGYDRKNGHPESHDFAAPARISASDREIIMGERDRAGH